MGRTPDSRLPGRGLWRFLYGDDNMLCVSTCRKEITPQGKFFPCYLMGHAIRTDPAEGIMDPLWATALVLEAEGERFVWVTVELIGLERDYTERLQAEIEKKYGIPPERTNICFVHTHSAPEYQLHSLLGTPGAVPGYMDFVAEQILAAVDGCFAAPLEPVRLFARTIRLEGCYGNRNGLDKPCDKSVTTLEFRSGDRVVAGAGHFTCHSTVLGPQNHLVSSDLAGYVARALERRWGVYPVIMIGAAGDMSNRLYRQGNDLAELERVGKEMMDQVFAGPEPQELNLTKPVVRTFRYQDTYYPDKGRKQQQYDEIEAKIRAARTFDEKKVYTSALALAKRGLECKPFVLDLVCRYWDLGDLKIMTIPAELFSRFGVQLKQAMGAKCPICWCYSNYSVGYLGNIEDYGASFETAASDIPQGTTEKIVERMVAFLKEEGETK